MLEHSKGNLTSKQKGHSGRWPAAFGCHCQLSYLLRQPAANRGVKHPKDKWRGKRVASIPISHPKLVFFLSRSLHLHGCDMLLASVKLGAMKSFPSKHTIRITPQTPVAADNSYNAAIFPDIFEKVIQLFLSWAFSSCCVPARLSSALSWTQPVLFFFLPSDSSKGDAECKRVSSENSLARAFWWWARDVLRVSLD